MHGKTTPEKITERHRKIFLTDLAVERNVSKSTQRVAFNAQLFLYKYVLKKQITTLRACTGRGRIVSYRGGNQGHTGYTLSTGDEKYIRFF